MGWKVDEANGVPTVTPRERRFGAEWYANQKVGCRRIEACISCGKRARLNRTSNVAG
jgi:hypothetical protein